MATETARIIEEQAAKILASGVLGRSRSYGRLFEYLVENSLADRAPKEFEIAADVFAKSAGFDPTQDSIVRVYAHNLRQKLRQFYEREGSAEVERIYIPRGEYRLAVESPETAAVEAEPVGVPPRAWSRWWLAAICAGTFAVGLTAGLGLDRELESVAQAAASPAVDSPLWRAMTDDELPVTVVVGDYYIFGELDEQGDVRRFVREFAINSPADLDDFIRRNREFADRYRDLDITYLADSTAAALGDTLSVLFAAGKHVDVVSMSKFDPGSVRTNHIVYVGYFSALDKLFDFAFAASALAIGETFDELWNIETGEVFTSDAGMPADFRNYRDYGYFSTFPGPGGNQFAIIAGTRDEGVKYSAQVVTDPQYVKATELDIPPGGIDDGASFELLFEVTGFNRQHIDARLVHAEPLDAGRIWRGLTPVPSGY
jgi:hypothetical protein